MNSVLTQMLEKFDIKNDIDKENALKEIIQEIVLCGLARSNYFDKVAFYGGSSLRIFYGLDRFSEDLDFCLIKEDNSFDLKDYFPYISNELKAYGLDFVLEEKEKVSESKIQTIMIKENTKKLFLTVFGANETSIFNKDRLTKIKIEVDTTYFSKLMYTRQFGLLPSPYRITLLDLPSLFAGKIHAILCRNWKKRVKGRDFYDFVFFIATETKVNIAFLREKLSASGFKLSDNFSLDDIKILLKQKFETVDFNSAKEDVFPFINNKNNVDIWDKEFFITIVDKLK